MIYKKPSTFHLNGVCSRDFEYALEYIYKGTVTIQQCEISSFMQGSEILLLKGLVSDETDAQLREEFQKSPESEHEFVEIVTDVVPVLKDDPPITKNNQKPVEEEMMQSKLENGSVIKYETEKKVSLHDASASFVSEQLEDQVNTLVSSNEPSTSFVIEQPNDEFQTLSLNDQSTSCVSEHPNEEVDSLSLNEPSTSCVSEQPNEEVDSLVSVNDPQTSFVSEKPHDEVIALDDFMLENMYSHSTSPCSSRHLSWAPNMWTKESLESEDSVRRYLKYHPFTSQINLDKKLTIIQRRKIVRCTAIRLVKDGFYPPLNKCHEVAKFLGRICNLPADCFYNKKRKGFLAYSIENLRKKLMPHQKKRKPNKKSCRTDEPCMSNCIHCQGSSSKDMEIHLDTRNSLLSDQNAELYEEYRSTSYYNQRLLKKRISDQVLRIPESAESPNHVSVNDPSTSFVSKQSNDEVDPLVSVNDPSTYFATEQQEKEVFSLDDLMLENMGFVSTSPCSSRLYASQPNMMWKKESLESEDSLRRYLKYHPATSQINLDQKLTILQRRKIVRWTAIRLLTDDHYPSVNKRLEVAKFLGRICNLPADCFHNKKGTGFLTCSLESRRRTLMAYQKRRISKKKSAASKTDGTCLSNCIYCEGSSSKDMEIHLDGMNSLPSDRHAELSTEYRLTFCYRQSLLKKRFSDQVLRVPKYAESPDLVLHDFRISRGSSADEAFLLHFNDTSAKIIAFCINSSSEVTRQLSHSKDLSNAHTHSMQVCKILMGLLPQYGRNRKSPTEAFQSLVTFIPVDSELDQFSEVEKSPYPKILAQGSSDRGFAFRILLDGVICTAGQQFVDTFDILFKMFFVFKIKYTPGLVNFFKFIQFFFYKIKSDDETIPPNIVELMYKISKESV